MQRGKCFYITALHSGLQAVSAFFYIWGSIIAMCLGFLGVYGLPHLGSG